MQDIKQRELKMQKKRKDTSFRDYLKTIVSFRSLGFYKNGGYTSIFPPTERIASIISHKEYEEKKSDLLKKGLEYNFGHSLFQNVNALFSTIQLPPTILFGENENSNYTDQTVNTKNAYLSYVIIEDCENILYSLSVKEHSSNILNSLMIWDHCENTYFSKGIIKSQNIFYSTFITNSFNIRFSTNMIGCTECLFCDGLQNKSYCINNKEYGREEYMLEKEKLLQNKSEFLLYYKSLSKDQINIGCENIQGSYNIQCSNIMDGYMNYQVSDGKNIILIGGKDTGNNIYDCFLNTPPENNMYGVFSAGFCNNIYNSYHIRGGSNIYYSISLENCSYCLGCVGLKNEQFCILNKQYTKEEWFELANKIFQQMESDNILGQSFPGWMNPFYFNDSAAYLIDDTFTKEEIEKEGYLRRDEEIKIDIPEGLEIVKNTELKNYQGFNDKGERTINPEILKKVIKDEKGNIYRIVKIEYDFLMKHGLPLPEIHWLDRIKLGFKFK